MLILNKTDISNLSVEEQIIIDVVLKNITGIGYEGIDDSPISRVATDFALLVKDFACGDSTPEKVMNLFNFNIRHFNWTLSELLAKLSSIETSVYDRLEEKGTKPSCSWFQKFSLIMSEAFAEHSKMENEIRVLNQRIAVLQSQNNELMFRVSRDFLTEILNFESISVILDEKLKQRQDKVESYLGVFMIDVDDFAQANNSYGHECGDKALKMVAYALSNLTKRENEFAARRSGDEFIIVADGKSIEELKDFGEAIRRSVSDSSIEYEGNIVKVTISVGGAYLQSSESYTVNSLIKAADSALYEAKSKRNTFVFNENSF